MNKSKIEWCDYTWNPLTGCLHGCEYCFARRIAERFSMKEWQCTNCIVAPTCPGMISTNVCGGISHYAQYRQKHDLDNPIRTFYPKRKIEPYPFGFEPTFHRYRLGEPVRKTKPQTIFVCSMADLFGEWVPDEWINEVLSSAFLASQHTYLFLTKNPKGYRKIYQKPSDFRSNLWFGATVNDEVSFSEKGFELFNYTGINLQKGERANRFLSIEPLLGEITKCSLENIEHVDWVIIGAQTGPGAVVPKKEWVQSIIDQCRAAGVPIFLKENLKWHETIQEFPW